MDNLTQIFEPYILKCRPGDWGLCKKSSVFWVKELAGKRKDLDLLIMAGYIHDIGWSGLIPDGLKL